MTALARYQRLECPGQWRETPGTPLREVVVSFGDASLILSDIQDGVALTHWSLPAVERANPGERPALYSPDPAGAETLEIEDATMVEAIEQVRRAIDAQRPHPGRLRRPLVVAGGLVALVAVLILLHSFLFRYAAASLPYPARVDISDKLLADLARIAGPACHSVEGDRALARLGEKLGPRLGDAAPPLRILVLPGGFDTTAHLPDGRILVQRELVEGRASPEVAAGFVLAEDARAHVDDPLVGLLRHAGTLATLRLLTSGQITQSAVRGYAEVLLTGQPAAPAPESLLARFAAVGVPSTPFAYALDPTGESVLALIEGDPFRGKAPPAIIADTDWVGLQGICAD